MSHRPSPYSPVSQDEESLLNSTLSTIAETEEEALLHDPEVDFEKAVGYDLDTPGRWLQRPTSWKQRCHKPLMLIWQFLCFLKPSFLPYRREEPGSGKPANKTAYFDGIRGVASLFVLFDHWAGRNQLAPDYGYNMDKYTQNLLRLPIIRLFYQGSAMVAVFFVVSGFVLSHRAIQRMHRHQHAELFASLSSLTFRRALRLLLPSFVSSVINFCFINMGLMPTPPSVANKDFGTLFSGYLKFLDEQSNPWDWEYRRKERLFEPHLWTIAVELRGSLVLFLVVLGLARSRLAIRLLVELFLMAHAFFHLRWDVALFLSGMVIAELEVLWYLKPDRIRTSSGRIASTVGLVAIMILGAFINSIPAFPNKVPGYMWTAQVWPWALGEEPARRFWMAIGAILMVGPACFLPLVQAFFVTRPIRYLASISYALYLVQFYANGVIGMPILSIVQGIIGKEPFWPMAFSFIVTTIIFFPFAFWIADVFWRGVDVPATNFARWLDAKCTEPAPSRPLQT